jgi:cystathionine beta-lyase/cystathionine gamma-synthase
MSKNSSKRLSLQSKLFGASDECTSHPLVAPLVQSTTFVQDQLSGTTAFAYSRVGNPTVSALESILGDLESADPAVCFSSGLAAETSLFLAFAKAGDHVVCGKAVYGGTTRLLQQFLEPLGIQTTFVDATDPAQIASAIDVRTKLLFLETPANPTLVLTDLAKACEIGRAAGCLVAVDNTFLTGALQQPLRWGADFSVYSTTKLLDGHSTALGGAVVGRDPELLERLRFTRKSLGSIQTPFNAWTTLNGLKTLPIRLRRQCRTSQRIAEWLADHSEIEQVYYPGLKDFPQRALADRQHLGGHGNVISLEVRGGYAAAVRLVKRLRLCRLVEHIGSVETLVTHAASMTHVDVPREQRIAAGISDGLLRLSIGLEPAGEIIADLRQALRVSQRTRCNRSAEVTA